MNLYSFILLTLFSLNCQNLVLSTPLDDYVNEYDPNYSFKVVNYTYKGPGFTLFCLNMTSQKWLNGYSFIFIDDENFSLF